MKRIAILGSTGSIGASALEVIRHFPGRFKVTGLSTNSNIDVLYKQIKEFHPEFVCVRNIIAANKLKKNLSTLKTELFVGFYCFNRDVGSWWFFRALSKGNRLHRR